LVPNDSPFRGKVKFTQSHFGIPYVGWNVDIHVISYVPFVYKAPLKTAGNLVVLSVDVQSNLPVGFIDTMGFVAFCINFVLSAINNNLVLILLAPNSKATPSVDVVKGTKYS
jgi:hypothetical protein